MSGWLLDYSYKCQPVDYSHNPSALRMANLCWWYFISKFTEFADTVRLTEWIVMQEEYIKTKNNIFITNVCKIDHRLHSNEIDRSEINIWFKYIVFSACTHKLIILSQEIYIRHLKNIHMIKISLLSFHRQLK